MDLKVSTENKVTALREEKVPARSPIMTQFLTPKKNAGRGPDSMKGEGARNEARPPCPGGGARSEGLLRRGKLMLEGTLDGGAE